MYLITKWFGTFLINEKGIIDKIIFPNNKDEIYKRLIKIKNNKILIEEKKLCKGLKVIVNEKRLEKIGSFSQLDSFFNKIEIDPSEFGISEKLLHDASLITETKRVDLDLTLADVQIIQMINALDDLIQIQNLLSECIASWSIIPNSNKKIKPIKNVISTVKNEIKILENQIDLDMKMIAPNISEIIGSIIGARLISFAGGLKNLALKPASTIQILGAEKALFRYKKEGGKPPKHGVIFQHNLINKNLKEIRGKISRIFANKIAIAAKADVFTKRNISNDLLKDLEKKIKIIKDQYRYK